MTPTELRGLLGARLVPNVRGISRETTRFVIVGIGVHDVRVVTANGAQSSIPIRELTHAIHERLLRIEPK